MGSLSYITSVMTLTLLVLVSHFVVAFLKDSLDDLLSKKMGDR